mgnify:CR=1 FL=1
MNIKLIGLNDNYHVLVTGGGGFIGSNLCETLLENGNKVTCLDNFATGKRENLSHFIKNPKFHLIEGDIRKLQDCQLACDGVDYILHQAALGSVPRSINDPITSNDVNVSGFLNMLVAARDANYMQKYLAKPMIWKRLDCAILMSLEGDKIPMGPMQP